MTLLLTYVCLSLAFSFLCSLLEAAFLSITPSYIAHLEYEQHRTGRLLRELKTNVDRPLAAILSLNTVSHTIGAALTGAQAQKVWGSEVLAIASVVLTILILVLAEIIPKSLGASHWRRLAPWTADVLRFLVWIQYPFVVLSERLTRFIGSHAHSGSNEISREEIAAMAKVGAEQGLFHKSESRMLTSLFKFGSLRARDIMTPRTVVVSLSEQTTVRSVIENKTAMRFSRLPIWRRNEDNVVGYVLKDEILLRAARDELQRTVSEFRREILVVPDSLPVAALLERLLNEREQVGLVVDEYGAVVGVVTVEDVVETLLGLEIVDEADTVQDMRGLARVRWLERARRLGIVPIEEMRPSIAPIASPSTSAPDPNAAPDVKTSSGDV